MAQKYSTEFKEQALEMVRETSVKEVSARLGVTDKTLYRWQQAKRLGAHPSEVSGDVEKQVKALRKEVEELRQANGILKKAMGFFVKG